MNVERKVLAVLFIAAGATMTGCSQDEANGEQPGATGLSNPAAVYCVDKGGTYEIRRADDGSETGVCILTDGTEVDAWAYFRDQ
ncbi:putative hemolysin [Phaeobacter gallaeciensis]|uniref:putative hemolysin n=1 Tax=Phaeobacter gallaeciensis TaxID=60890 RepID=UPI00237EED0E|nr:DUF333 domain-containing protein [Phaeobacter gallaeciensis]MDE4191880.1 DUF333 domain-containing protein [Phaeobacter gallaeciensis]MDE4200343.1 DUF333 domain-containing protein [Phaeobacter gallaeciensis]MDE4204209.1 DUF333 domain-containing protein [Phaeobacter gallaeciensis]MDE4208635.1 DUF333 domain-containing protein [Phaeobacter gallaeciensis]MDE4216718.1 DUF333 domain-containing protein [Phaeobacter gallaeciensis]